MLKGKTHDQVWAVEMKPSKGKSTVEWFTEKNETVQRAIENSGVQSGNPALVRLYVLNYFV